MLFFVFNVYHFKSWNRQYLFICLNSCFNVLCFRHPLTFIKTGSVTPQHKRNRRHLHNINIWNLRLDLFSSFYNQNRQNKYCTHIFFPCFFYFPGFYFSNRPLTPSILSFKSTRPFLRVGFTDPRNDFQTMPEKWNMRR